MNEALHLVRHTQLRPNFRNMGQPALKRHVSRFVLLQFRLEFHDNQHGDAQGPDIAGRAATFGFGILGWHVPRRAACGAWLFDRGGPAQADEGGAELRRVGNVRGLDVVVEAAVLMHMGEGGTHVVENGDTRALAEWALIM